MKTLIFSGKLLLILPIAALLAASVFGQAPFSTPTPAGGSTSRFTTYDPETLRKGEWNLSQVLSAPQTFTLHSRLLAHDVSYRVIVPAEYDQPAKSATRYPVIYLLHGLDGHFDNWTDKTSLADYVANFNFIVVTPEGNNGWYTDSATVANDKYESYIVQELIPEIDRRFQTIAERRGRAIAGLSMGGYGSIKFGLKHPEMFSLVGSFSGAFDAPLRTAKTPNLWPSIPIVFGAEGGKTRTDNDVFALLRAVPTDRIAGLPFIYFDCGTEDPFLAINRDFDALLLEKKVPHEYRELPGKHNWEYWNQQVPEFLQVAGRIFGIRKKE